MVQIGCNKKNKDIKIISKFLITKQVFCLVSSHSTLHFHIFGAFIICKYFVKNYNLQYFKITNKYFLKIMFDYLKDGLHTQIKIKYTNNR